MAEAQKSLKTMVEAMAKRLNYAEQALAKAAEAPSDDEEEDEDEEGGEGS